MLWLNFDYVEGKEIVEVGREARLGVWRALFELKIARRG